MTARKVLGRNGHLRHACSELPEVDRILVHMIAGHPDERKALTNFRRILPPEGLNIAE